MNEVNDNNFKLFINHYRLICGASSGILTANSKRTRTNSEFRIELVQVRCFYHFALFAFFAVDIQAHRRGAEDAKRGRQAIQNEFFRQDLQD